MKRELTIIIAGEAGTGKSTMAVLLEDWLMKQGFNVEMDLENEMFDYGGKLNFYTTLGQNWPKRIEAIKTNTKIILKSMQTKRGSTEEENNKSQS